MPDSSNHSLFFIENEGNLGGNQLLDGSIGLSSLRRRRTICPSVSARAFARDSPDFAFFRHFRGFFRVWYSNHSQDHGQWQVCMCVCVCGCVLCMLCGVVRVEKHGKPEETERNVCGMVCVCVVWCCEVRNTQKHEKHWENSQNTDSFFGTIWPSVDPKTVRKRPFFPTHCFYTSPGICRRFWPEVLTQTPKNAVFQPRSYSKGPNHALEKVLTKETPGIAE